MDSNQEFLLKTMSLVVPDLSWTNTSSTVHPDQSSTNTSSKEEQLWEINERNAITLIPAMMYVGLLAVIGLFANVLVCYVFVRHFILSVNTFLLLFLAVLDVLNCSVAMPFEIAEMRFNLVFHSEIACKIFRAIVAFPNINSMFILLIITVDRYIKVCRPMKRQMKLKDAKLYVTIATAFALLTSFPALYIYGLKTVPTSIDGVSSSDCTTSDAMTSSIIPLIYQTLGGILMMLICAALLYLYACIWREIRRHKKYVRNNTQLALKSPSTSRRQDHPPTNSDPQERASPERGSFKPRFASGQRITVIAFTVSLLFILSNVPYAVILVFRAVKPSPFYTDNNKAWVAMRNILIRSFFISSVTNPVVYGFMSKRFRRECLKLGTIKCW